MTETKLSTAERIKLCRKESGETLEQLGQALGVHKSTVMRWEKGETGRIGSVILNALAAHFGVSSLWLCGEEGEKKPDSRSHTSARIPVIGYVKAGIPIEAVEEILDYEEIPEEMALQGNYFALRVRGSSMEPRICEGDVVIVRMQESVDNGDVAVALVGDNETTVKKFFRDEDGIRLTAFNPSFETMVFSPEEVNALPVKVIGKVVELRGKM